MKEKEREREKLKAKERNDKLEYKKNQNDKFVKVRSKDIKKQQPIMVVSDDLPAMPSSSA